MYGRDKLANPNLLREAQKTKYEPSPQEIAKRLHTVFGRDFGKPTIYGKSVSMMWLRETQDFKIAIQIVVMTDNMSVGATTSLGLTRGTDVKSVIDYTNVNYASENDIVEVVKSAIKATASVGYTKSKNVADEFRKFGSIYKK